MRFIEVKGFVPRQKKWGRLRVELETFMSMNIKTAKVDYAECEYKKSITCYKCLWNAARRYAMPIRVAMIDGEIYLIRRDM